MKTLAVASALLMVASISGLAPASVCAQPSNPLTPGNVTLNLAVGKTTQAEVLQVFGAPNIVTQDGSRQEVWSYQRHATVTQGTESSAYFSILLAGAGSSKSSKTETQRTMTLIIKFDANRVVSDFSSRASEF